MKRGYCVLLLTAFLCFSTVAAAFATTVDLGPDYPVKQPDNSCWCWAACTRSTIIQYKGTAPILQTIANYVWQVLRGKSGDAPYSMGATVDETKAALEHNGIVCSRKFDDLSWTAVRSQINNNHLCMGFFKPSSGMGHVELICGWSNTWPWGNRVKYMEPCDGSTRWTSYDNFANGSIIGAGWTWFGSIFDCEEAN